jgi:hypothetical protein
MRQEGSLSHTRRECKYHIVFIPKYRKKAIFGQIRRDLGDVLKRLAQQKESRSIGRINAVSQTIPGQVCGEQCTSARWYAGPRGANADCLALLTSYFALLCRRAQPSAQPIPCPGIEPTASEQHPLELTALRETLCSLAFAFHLRTRNRPRKHG